MMALLVSLAHLLAQRMRLFIDSDGGMMSSALMFTDTDGLFEWRVS